MKSCQLGSTVYVSHSFEFRWLAFCLLQHCAAPLSRQRQRIWGRFEGSGAASSLSGQSDVATLPEDADVVGHNEVNRKLNEKKYNAAAAVCRICRSW
jgi:hypothetical protein